MFETEAVREVATLTRAGVVSDREVYRNERPNVPALRYVFLKTQSAHEPVDDV